MYYVGHYYLLGQYILRLADLSHMLGSSWRLEMLLLSLRLRSKDVMLTDDML